LGVVVCGFLQGFLRKRRFDGGVFVVSCGGMCGKRGAEAASFCQLKNRTGF
jgi:hypothetical protein